MDTLKAYIGRVSSLTKSYGSLTAMDSISSHKKESEITSLLGPNGAVKMAIIQMLPTLVAPKSGNIRIFVKVLKERR